MRVEQPTIAGGIAFATGVADPGEEIVGASDDAEVLDGGFFHGSGHRRETLTMTNPTPMRNSARIVPNTIGFHPGLIERPSWGRNPRKLNCQTRCFLTSIVAHRIVARHGVAGYRP